MQEHNNANSYIICFIIMWILNILLIVFFLACGACALPEGHLDGVIDIDVLENVIGIGTDNLLQRGTLLKIEDALFQPFGILHSINKLSHWSGKEEDIYNVLLQRREQILQEIDLITRFVTDYEETSGNALAWVPVESSWDRGRLIGASPVLAHQMTDRYSGIVDSLRQLINSEEYYTPFKNVIETLELLQPAADTMSESDKLSLLWPNRQDLMISLTSLLEIQSFYDFELTRVMNGLGTTFDTEFTGTLNFSDFMLLGVFGLNSGHHYLAIDSLEFLLDHIANLEIQNGQVVGDPTWINFLKSVFRFGIQAHNYEFHMQNRSEYTVLYSFIGPLLHDNTESRYPLLVAQVQHFGGKYGNLSNDRLNMYTLCNDHEFQPKHIKSQLHCFLDKKRHPYFILNPLKTEELSKYPHIVQFYDVLGNDSMKELIESRGELGLSKVRGTDTEESIIYRSSAGAITDVKYMWKIQNKSEILTGLLLTDMAEGIQTVEYTYGRYYKVHTDPFSRPINPIDTMDISVREFGDRLATLLYYVDEPRYGGDTIFAQVGIRAHPVRGSAIFWINMFRNGGVRPDVSHCACPVIHGHKTIINQWIRYNSNFQTFKCSLDQFE